MIGRPREQAPDGHVTVREGAEILGISKQALRGRIERGSLEADRIVLESGEARYYIPKEELERARGLLRSELNIKEEAEGIRLNSASLARGILSELRGTREAISNQLDRNHSEHTKHILMLAANQEKILGKVGDAVEEFAAMAAAERNFQERLITALDDERERNAARSKAGKPERRGFFRRLFWNT